MHQAVFPTALRPVDFSGKLSCGRATIKSNELALASLEAPAHRPPGTRALPPPDPQPQEHPEELPPGHSRNSRTPPELNFGRTQAPVPVESKGTGGSGCLRPPRVLGLCSPILSSHPPSKGAAHPGTDRAPSPWPTPPPPPRPRPALPCRQTARTAAGTDFGGPQGPEPHRRIGAGWGGRGRLYTSPAVRL